MSRTSRGRQHELAFGRVLREHHAWGDIGPLLGRRLDDLETIVLGQLLCLLECQPDEPGHTHLGGRRLAAAGEELEEHEAHGREDQQRDQARHPDPRARALAVAILGLLVDGRAPTGSHGRRPARLSVGARVGVRSVGDARRWIGPGDARGHGRRARRGGPCGRRSGRTEGGGRFARAPIGKIGLERLGERCGAREALGGVRRHRLPNDRIEAGRNAGPEVGRSRWRSGQSRERDRGRAVALPRAPAGQQLEQDDPKGVDVRGGCRPLATCLLRAEVVDRPERRPGQRHLGVGDGPGDPEVGHLDPAVAGEKDVARLDVAMDEPARVRGGKRPRGLGDDARGLARREGAAATEDRRQVLAVDEFHDDEGAGRVLSEVVDRDDVGMVQRRGRVRLLSEPGAEVRVPTVLGTEELHRDVAIELGVVSPVDRRHAALAEQLDEPVTATQRGADLRQA